MSPEYLNLLTLEKTNWPPTATTKRPPTLKVLPPSDPLLTTREAAVILKVSVECLKKWRRRGVPAFIKYDSGAVRYRLSVLLHYVSDCTAKR